MSHKEELPKHCVDMGQEYHAYPLELAVVTWNMETGYCLIWGWL